MNDLYTQIILSARNDDIEGWMNILFVVILAVFWALGGLFKAKSKRFITEQEESSPDGTSHKQNVSSKFARQDLNQKTKQPSSAASVLRRQYRRQVEQLRRRISPRPITLILDSKSKPVVSSSENIISDIQPTSVKYFVPKIESKASVQSDYANASSESASTAIDSLFDYTNPDELKRAILHYEILGKPLSLRNPGEQNITDF